MLNADGSVNSDLPPSRRIRVLVAGDGPSSRNRLVDLLRVDRDVGLIFLAEDGNAAISVIEKEQPDIVLLDVRMPHVDGFGVIEAIGVDKMPLTVFVTGCARSPARAWEVGAVDYVLRPFGDERFFSAMQRAKTRLLHNSTRNKAACSRF